MSAVQSPTETYQCSVNRNMDDSVSISSCGSPPDVPIPEPLCPNRYQPVSPLTASTASRPSIEPTNFAFARCNMPWEDNYGSNNCYSDAATASTVLNLLHKEPLSPLRGTSRMIHLDSELAEEQRLRCVVCFEPFDYSSCPEPPLAAKCDHRAIPGVHMCTSCLCRCLDNQFASSGPDSLSCPLCHARLSHDEIRKWASPSTFQAYDNIKVRRALESDNEFITCVRPGCGSGQLHMGGRENPIVVCGSCGTRMCYVHRHIPWHEGLSCDEYDRIFMPMPRTNDLETRNSPPQHTSRFMRKIGEWRACRSEGRKQDRETLHRIGRINWTTEDLLSQRAIWQIAKPCPRCNAITEKEGGCKFMKCMCSFSLRR